jgi:hypothetical protein
LISKNNDNAASLQGEVAHIVGETTSAARGKYPTPLHERNRAYNLLLLCRKHHKTIDDDESQYTVEKLHEVKKDYLDWVRSSLVKPHPWKTNMSQLCYINVPRLCEVAELKGIAVDLSGYREGKTLHSLGWDLNQVMSSFRRILSAASPDAIPIRSPLEFPHEDYIGAVVVFERMKFRTRNIPALDSLQEDKGGPVVFSGDLARDPHIYFTAKTKWKFILTIDPTWITTGTAFVLFRRSGGQSTFSGLARVTSVDYEKCILLGTPWVIGPPASPLDDVTDMGGNWSA